uniref:Translocation and assembly module TamB C-terminal domain-containing protein n=2 Tax=Kalanchoe fedtschenkoi TaxID=63787 RepID=A0A7N0VLC3_KALFE
MMSANLNSGFLGVGLGSSINLRGNGGLVQFGRGQVKRGFRICVCEKQNNWANRRTRFLNIFGTNIELLKQKLSSGSGWEAKCVEERFVRGKDLARSFAPLWREGIFLVRCSAFVAVISGVCLLVWYGRARAKSFVEAKLLPSVCSILSEYIQREIDVGKVKKISPLSITLESCAIGPHAEEFSCGEIPTLKLRLHPFASLRRGKIVIDAVVTNPTVLVVQKKDYTWLGIPSYEDDGVQGHLSTEEGIDYRTKTRRIAREEAAARWEMDRDNGAVEAAKLGFFIDEQPSYSNDADELKVAACAPSAVSRSDSFLCTDEGMHWRDHHCMDTGVQYDLKHANLEKSFGIKLPGSGLKFWSKIISGPSKLKFKRKSSGSDVSGSVTCKLRVLERSGSAAAKYFLGLSHRETEPPDISSDGDSMHLANFYAVNHEGGSYPSLVSSTEDEKREPLIENGQTMAHKENEKTVKNCHQEVISISETQVLMSKTELETSPVFLGESFSNPSKSSNVIRDPFVMTLERLTKDFRQHLLSNSNTSTTIKAGGVSVSEKDIEPDENGITDLSEDSNEPQQMEPFNGSPDSQKVQITEGSSVLEQEPWSSTNYSAHNQEFYLKQCLDTTIEQIWGFLKLAIQNLKSGQSGRTHISSQLDIGDNEVLMEKNQRLLPVALDSVRFRGGTLMILAYGDREPREMENVEGRVTLQNHYSRVHVQLSGHCKMWRSEKTSDDGGWLSADVFVDIVEQQWHANLKVVNIFAPLFERILDIPIIWSKGRADGEVHLCMSRGESFPNLHGQLDVTGLAFQILDAPSSFSDITASLCFRGQRIFLHNASGWFGNVPLEASGDFGIHPEEGEFHLMCQVPFVEVNELMRSFKIKPLLFPLAGSVTAVFNCQGPLDAPIFVGSAMVSRKISHLIPENATSPAFEAMIKNKEAGAVAAFDRIPFSYLSANFTFNTDNCVADMYGIRASLVDGGEIRGAGNIWICPEGETDDSAMDVDFSGTVSFDKIFGRYLQGYPHLIPLKLGDINGETKLSGSLLKPRFDIKWAAPKAEGSFGDARGDILISHDCITVNSSSVAFELYTKVQISCPDDYWFDPEHNTAGKFAPLVVEGVDLDLRMRGFEFFSFISSYSFDFPRPVHLKSSGRIKFHGKVVKHYNTSTEKDAGSSPDAQGSFEENEGEANSLVGDISISGLKLNQLMLAPQLGGLLRISRECIKLDANGRPDESLSLEIMEPLEPHVEGNLQNRKLFSFSLQKGQLRANACYRPLHMANLEVRHLPLDELELASLRGTIQKAEIQLNLQKRRGHGVLSVIRPKFSGVLGEALDVAARWSGDVITVEKTVLEQSKSRYELQGEYVLPGSRDRSTAAKERGGIFNKAVVGNLGSLISSMGRWRMRLEVPQAEVAEMLPLARLLSRSTDPTVRSRSKDLFMQSLQSVGICGENLQTLLEVMRGHFTTSPDEVVLEDLSLPGLAELKGRWQGSLDASGGGNGDTVADFDLHGEDWEWGTYGTHRVLAVGAYSNDDGLRLEKMFIQKDNATVHADGTLLGPKTNLHFAVLNCPVSLVPTVVQVIESSATDSVHSLRQLLAPIKGILHMEGDLRGSLAKPECDVQVRLLDGAIGGIDLGRAEVVASLTSTSRFLFNAKFEPAVQNGHVHVQGSVPVTFVQNKAVEEENTEVDRSGATWIPEWMRERVKGSADEINEKKAPRDRNEEGWDPQLAESLKGLNWNLLDAGEVRVDADIKDGGMMLLTALSPYAKWLHGNADITLQVRGTVEQPVLDGSASFHRASVSSHVLRKPLTNFGGAVQVKSNRLCITSLESRVSRRGKLFIKGNLPLRSSEASVGDKIDLKCEVLEVRAKNILSGQVDTQMQITGSILQPNISGKIKLSHGEAYLPHDKGSGAATFNRLTSNQLRIPSSVSRAVASRYVSRFFGSESAALSTKFPQASAKQGEPQKGMGQLTTRPELDVRLTDLKLILGPELKIVYPLILNFAVSGELELNGIAHPKLIKPRGILAFENGDVNLVATQVRLKREYPNVAKFEPDHGLDPMLDLTLVGSEWQFKIQSRASQWQDNLVVTSTRSVEQDALSPSEAAKVFESQLAESILEGDGQLAFKKLATATLETLMPRIEGKGEFGQARWRLVYAPQIHSLLSVDPTVDPFKSLANISFGTEVEVQLGKRLQASVVRQMKESEMAMQWTLIYQLTSRLRVLLQSAPYKRLLFEYSATSQD